MLSTPSADAVNEAILFSATRACERRVYEETDFLALFYLDNSHLATLIDKKSTMNIHRKL